ncbi:MAG: ATP-binding protein [Myxococcota bacterium]|nr:ATP-binding protein [Myxococcota bacterium]
MSRDLTGILDAVLAGILVFDADGRLEMCNAAACRILEISADNAEGSPVESLLGPDHALASLARGALAHGHSATANECAVERRFDEDLTVDVSAAPLCDALGRADGAVIFLRDGTLQRDLQRRVLEREHLAAFESIAAGVAHEVKNPLGGIRGAAEILGSRATDTKTADTARLIVREVDRIAAILDDLMVFTQGDDIAIAPANVHQLLESVLSLIEHDPASSNVELQREFDPSIPEVFVDARRLTQVFLNLARNAVQAMEGSGTLTIRTRMRLDRRLTNHAGQQYPTLRIEFRDTGPGIPAELIDRLATPFFTTRVGGTGLGLAVARHWVVRHEGILQIESPPGSGARMRVELPLRTSL